MLLKDPKHMAELFSLLNKLPAAIYQNNELIEACNNVLLLEEHEPFILALGRYSIEDILYGRFYWYTKFLCRYETIYGKDAGMEQAQFKIVEAMDYAGVVDCDTLEAIEQELGYIKYNCTAPIDAPFVSNISLPLQSSGNAAFGTTAPLPLGSAPCFAGGGCS